MRVRIEYSIDVDDTIRRGINRWYGVDGLASREQVKRWYESQGSSMDDDLYLQESAKRSEDDES
jgi:hypothetical protein